jgi:hypothetical protein
MNDRVVRHFAAVAAALSLAACGGAGGGFATGADASAQRSAYVPQSTGPAFPQPVPESPSAALAGGISRNITSPIIDDSGAYTNGPIIRATNTTTGYGMEGLTNGAGAGVYGHAGSSSSASYGVYGFSPGGAGVFGYDSTNGAGVLGSSVGGVGVKGVSAGPNAWGGYFTNTATGGWAVSAAATGSTALQAISVSGIGVEAETNSIWAALIAGSIGTGPALLALGGAPGSGNGTGGYFKGTDLGLLVQAPSSVVYAILATDSQGNNVFHVDGNGNVASHGTYTTLVATKTSGRTIAYDATAIAPTIEDTGSARLVNGSATIALDATFAQTIDRQRPYHVMITPDGETQGLYVAAKTAGGFVVREVRGGHRSLGFDYHIYATALDAARESAGAPANVGRGILPGNPADRADVSKPALGSPDRRGASMQTVAEARQPAGALPPTVPGKTPALTVFPQSPPEPLIALGREVSRDLTSPIINDSGAYSNGPIILGTDTTSGYGMEGITDGSGAGVYGHAASTNVTSYGVYGFSPGGAGVYGHDGKNRSGILGSSVSGYGVEGMSAANNSWGGYFTNTGGGGALYAQATGGTVGTVIQAYSANAVGLSAQSTNNIALYATNAGDGVAVSIGGNGIAVGGDIEGTKIGVVGAGIDPFVVENTAGNDIFYIDDTGQVYATGTYATFIATATRGKAPAFGETATTPTIEDAGSARLTDGSAVVPLDAAFAQTIDTRSPYQVMITPEGDTRGLYVASKTGSGFVVREFGGGHGSVAFDYHIYATALGRGGERMAIVPGGAAAGAPRTPLAQPHSQR